MEIDWTQRKDEPSMEKEVDKYILYSFRKNFKIHDRDIELFEPSKILGDVFEAVMGAVFIDSGSMEAVLAVYQHLLAPFILFVAKFSKQLNKEPKEDFTLLGHKHKLLPRF
jgi:dsRNA-specific ribonuclease